MKIKPGRQHHSPVTDQLLKLYSISDELEISCQIDHNGLNDPFKVDAIVDSWARLSYLIIDQSCLLPSATKFAGQGPSVQFADGTQKAISEKNRCSLTLARLQRFLSTRGFLSFAVDPLCYTLLYPFGDEGFSLKLKSMTGKKIPRGRTICTDCVIARDNTPLRVHITGNRITDNQVTNSAGKRLD